MVLALILRFLLIKEKEQRKTAAIDATPPHTPTAGMTWLLGLDK